MALITCPECGNEISDQAISCPRCGYQIKEAVVTTAKKQIKAKKKALLAGLLIIVVVAIGTYIFSNTLNEYEQLAVENCQRIKNALKNPDSFTLYSDILIYPADEKYDTLMYISYGGTNSYGGMVKKVAIFEANHYIGDISDERSDFDTQSEYNHFLIAEMRYEMGWTTDSVSADKIIRKVK